MRNLIQIVIAVVILYVFFLIFCSLALVIWKVIQTDRMIAQVTRLCRDRGNGNMLRVLEKHRNTKAVVAQAMSYILAFLLGVVPPFLLSIGAVDTSGQSDESIKFADNFEKLTLVFLPLQGFFNFVIFVSFKIYNYRRVRPDVGIGRVITLLFCTSAHDPCFISRISVVMKNERDGDDFVEEVEVRQPHQVFDVDIKDESNEELMYRIGLMNNNGQADDLYPIPVSEDKSQSNQETLSSGGPSNSSDHRPVQATENASQNHSNSASSFLSYASRSSFTNNSLWEKNLSIDEESRKEEVKKKTYYR